MITYKGFANLDKHYNNLKKFGVNVIVCLNKFDSDLDSEIKIFEDYCKNKNYTYNFIC